MMDLQFWTVCYVTPESRFERTKHPLAFKVRVPFEAVKEDRTSAKLAGRYQGHLPLIRTRKQVTANGAAELLNGKTHVDSVAVHLQTIENHETLYSQDMLI
jgi:hypothetical protein